MSMRKMRVPGKGMYALCLLLTASCLCSCGANPAQTLKFSHEIVTMTQPDEKKMTITIRAEYNVGNEDLRSALEKKFPDVNFVTVFHCSQETQYELRQSLLGGSAEDLVISPNMKGISDIAADSLLDLSTEACVQNYQEDALEACQLNGKIYYLPGPSAVYGIVYDKTMFEEKGWQVPHSYEEFLQLVMEINASGIRAFQPSCKYARQAQIVFTMFNYQDVFGGVDNYRWLQDYQAGTASMKGHVEEAIDRYQKMHEAGIIEAEDFDMQPGNRSKMLYTDHTCAMIIENQMAETYAKQAGSDHTYGMFPFYSGEDENSGYLMAQPGYYIGLNKSLAEKGNEKKLAAVREVMDYISTPEGQLAISGGKMTQISNVRDTAFTKDDFNAGITSAIENGNLVPEVDLMSSGNNNAAELALKTDLQKLLEGTKTADALMEDCDAARTKALGSGIDKGAKVGTAEKTFTCLETGLFIADALKQKAGADIGLCLVGTTHCGMVGRIYQGDIYEKDVTSLSLSVGTVGSSPDDKKLWLVSMTGAQIMDLLKEGYTFNPNDNVPNIPYYVASGLNIRFAPWKTDKLVSVTMADGSALKEEQTYKVALWGWPFDDKCQGTVEKVYDDSCDDILTAAIKNAGSLKPSSDKSFQLEY